MQRKQARAHRHTPKTHAYMAKSSWKSRRFDGMESSAFSFIYFMYLFAFIAVSVFCAFSFIRLSVVRRFVRMCVCINIFFLYIFIRFNNIPMPSRFHWSHSIIAAHCRWLRLLSVVTAAFAVFNVATFLWEAILRTTDCMSFSLDLFNWTLATSIQWTFSNLQLSHGAAGVSVGCNFIELNCRD